MLGENIKILRKQKGYSQETLAQQLNVVRQTISKWEKGLSVPDAQMLEQIADLFEVSVDELLGNPISEEDAFSDENEVVKQLAILNQQLALQSQNRKRFLKIVGMTIGIVLMIFVLVPIISILLFGFVRTSESAMITRLNCTIDDQRYIYEITYDDQYRILTAGGHQYIADHVEVEKYNDANVLIAQIEDYFYEHQGICEINTHHQEHHR